MSTQSSLFTRIKNFIPQKSPLTHLERWNICYAELLAYKKKMGDCNVPRDWQENPQLGGWVNMQRRYYCKHLLSAERIEKLNAIDFNWNGYHESNESKWEKHYHDLIAYREQYGHCNVPTNWPENPQLTVWVDGQRQLYHKHFLNKERIQKLNSIGFSWDRHEDKWEKQYRNLVAYKDRQGHCHVPRYWQENPQLGSWVGTQRQQYYHHLLSPEKIQKLNAIGFNWDTTICEQWEKHYRDLISYKNQHGHCNVPKNQQNLQLAAWVAAQRSRYAKGLLSRERIQKLNDIHFSWELRKDQWQKYYSALISYKNQQGHCDVPHNWTRHPQLSVWVARQRQLYHKHLLNAEKMEKLNALDFSWNSQYKHKLDAIQWQKRYAALGAYKDQQGHCDVPRYWQENRQLANWVVRQRRLYRKHLLSAERIEKLNALGFNWNPQHKRKPDESKWQKHYSALITYKEQHGHCNVPYYWQENSQLGRWIDRQRQFYRKHLLSVERIQKLNNINFLWNPGTSSHKK